MCNSSFANRIWCLLRVFIVEAYLLEYNSQMGWAKRLSETGKQIRIKPGEGKPEEVWVMGGKNVL
jgi:hypothetical protein